MGKFLNRMFGGSLEPEDNNLEVRSDTPTIVPPPQFHQIVVTVETALSLGPVARAVNIITTIGSGITWDGYNKDGKKLERQPSLITKPGVEGSPYVFKAETLNNLACYGNAYWRIYGDSPSNYSLEVLDPAKMHVSRDHNTGRVIYDYTDEFGRQWQNIKVKHLKMNRRPGHLLGYGPIQLNYSVIKEGLSLKAYSSNWFTSGVPRGYWEAVDAGAGQFTNGGSKEDLSKAWKAYLEGHSNATFVDGYKYVWLDIDPKNAMFVDVQKYSDLQIGRVFGIPAMHLLVELSGTSMTYTNLEQDQILFLQDTIVGYLNEIEEAMTDLPPRGTYCKFNEDDLLRMDHRTKLDVRKGQIETGQRTADELRAEDGLDALPPQRKEANDE